MPFSHDIEPFHSEKQNVVKLARIIDGKNLSLPSPSDACIPCARGTLQVEPHTDSPIPGQRRLELVHIDVIGPF